MVAQSEINLSSAGSSIRESHAGNSWQGLVRKALCLLPDPVMQNNMAVNLPLSSSWGSGDGDVPA